MYSQFIQANIRQPFQVPLDSAFDRLKMNSGRRSRRSVSQPLTRVMARASRLAGPDNAVPSLPGSDNWLSKKKQKNPEPVPARLGAVKLHFRCCRKILDLVVNKRASITVGLVTCLWLCLTVSPVRSTHNHCTRQASGMHDLWQWCNGKATEALSGRRSTARWLGLRKLVFVRLPLSRNRESNFSLTDLLTFLFSSSGNCLKNFATDFLFLSND